MLSKFYCSMCIVPKEPTFKHFSHKHPLVLTTLNQEAAGTAICSGCNINIATGREYYMCKICKYSLHRKCYNLPRKFRHIADPDHDLNLICVPSFKCKACGLQGSGFSYNCSHCLVHYHSRCSQMPLTLTYSSHPHPLELQSGNPPMAFRCFECGNRSFDHWFYRCSVCEFVVHINCITPPNHQAHDHDNTAPPIIPMPPNGAPPGSSRPSTSSTDNPNYVTQAANQQTSGGGSGGDGDHEAHGKPGMKGLVVTGVATGFSEGVGQQAANSLFGLVDKISDKLKN